MSTSHGSKATFRVGAVATPTVADQDLSIYANSLGVHFTRDNAETTTMGANSKKHIPGLKDATLPFAGPYDTAGEAIIYPLFDGGVLTAFEYAPAGHGVVGTPIFTGTAFFTSWEVSSGVGGPNAVSSGLQVTGDVTRTIQ